MRIVGVRTHSDFLNVSYTIFYLSVLLEKNPIGTYFKVQIRLHFCWKCKIRIVLKKNQRNKILYYIKKKKKWWRISNRNKSFVFELIVYFSTATMRSVHFWIPTAQDDIVTLPLGSSWKTSRKLKQTNGF